MWNLAVWCGVLASATTLMEPLTLDAAMSYARDHAPAVHSAEAQVLLARARVGGVQAARWPTAQGALSTGAGLQASQPWMRGFTPCVLQNCMSPAGGSLDATVSVSAHWTVYDFGRTSAAMTSAERSADATRVDAESVARQAALEAAVAFLDVAASQELRATRARMVQERDRALAVARERVRVETAAPIEVTRATVSLETARLDLANAEASLRDSQVGLARALGLEPTREVSMSAAWLTSTGMDPERAADLAQTRRPELRAARLRTAASAANEDAARAAFRPTLGASANAGLGATAGLPPALGTSQSATAGLTLSVPLLDRTLFSNAEVARAQTAATRSSERELLLAVRAEAAQAALQCRMQSLALSQAEQLALQAAANLELAEGRYREGAGSLLELIDAQTQSAQAQLAVIQGRYGLGSAQVRLAAATGELAAR